MAFRLNDLSTELALEILRLAAIPDYLSPTYDRSHAPYYSTAVRLCYVSYSVRQAVMPSLLHTVVLSTHRNHLAFSNAFLLQHKMRREGSRLAVDYSLYIRRFWSSFCHPTIAGQWHISIDELDFDVFAEILCNVETLGFSFDSLHLLYLSLANKNTGKWRCKKLVFAGSKGRWNPLVQSPEGAEFLGGVTHLAVWAPHMHPLPSDRGKIIAPEIQDLPFDKLASLSHFACTLWGRTFTPSSPFYMPEKALVYGGVGKWGALELRELLRSSDPLREGVVIPFREKLRKKLWPNEFNAWEEAFFEGYAESVWYQGDQGDQ